MNRRYALVDDAGDRSGSRVITDFTFKAIFDVIVAEAAAGRGLAIA